MGDRFEVCVILSFSEWPLFALWSLWSFICALIISFHGFSVQTGVHILIFVLLVSWFYFLDSGLMIDQGLFSLISARIYATVFIWFIFSEIFLFLGLFWSLFALQLSSHFQFTFSASNYFLDISAHSIFFLDLNNILLQTLFLFVSGLCANSTIFALTLKSSRLVLLFWFYTLMLSLLFLIGQVSEFISLNLNFNLDCFSSSLLSLESLHFVHVFSGFIICYILFGRFIWKLWSVQLFGLFYFLVCYWHFVDCIWFLLVRFVYFSF